MPSCAHRDGNLVSLVYELLDAHADTLALASDPADEIRWAAHLEYLRALQRAGQEVLAHAGKGVPAARGDAWPW
jgi:hypothetical protein